MMTYTTRAAAAALGLSRHSVKAYCQRYGVGQKHGRDWLLTPEDIEVIRAHKMHRGETTTAPP